MSTAAVLRRTALYESHRRLNARLVDFHGWELPVQYGSILREHEAVRNRCGLFDVSHMGQIFVLGSGALDFLQSVNVNDVGRIAPGQALYSHMANERGGVVDDVIVSCLERGRYLVVVNAANAVKDLAWLKAHAGSFDVAFDDASDRCAMIALQGPAAAGVMALLDAESAALARWGAREARLFDQPCVITRTGYTGEDGFELVVPNETAVRVWEDLLAKGRSFGAEPCGLGARDVLRLEAGLLLYGQDMDEEHTSLEAGCGWVVKLEKGDFVGRAALLEQRRQGPRRRLTGLRLRERGVPRAGAPMLAGGRRIGTLCSATFSPSLQAGIGWGYVDGPALPAGSPAAVSLHGRELAAEIVKTPFYRSSHLK